MGIHGVISQLCKKTHNLHLDSVLFSVTFCNALDVTRENGFASVALNVVSYNWFKYDRHSRINQSDVDSKIR